MLKIVISPNHHDFSLYNLNLKFEIEGLQQQQRIRKILMACSFQILLNCHQTKY